MRTTLFTFAMLCAFPAFSQVDWTEGWDSETIQKAKVFGATKMSKTEKDVIFYCNLVRLNPNKFLTTILPKYIASRELKTTRFISSLKRDLKKTKKLEALKISAELYTVANGHAVASGKRGTTGHQNYEKRFKAVNKEFSTNGENCDYGNNKAIDIFFSWLIDEGIANLGHRKNILDTEFNYAAVSIEAHKTYDVNAVMTFGMK